MNCIVSINKPCGLSSSDVVIRCRNAMSKALGYRVKCGHFGTLDPAASGVLVLGFGKATRLFDFMQIKTKKYLAEITFGKTTDTLDKEGVVIATSQLPLQERIEGVVSSFEGEIMQTPPQYSALSVDGVRAYKLARQGKSVQLPQRKVKISHIAVINKACSGGLCQSAEIEIECSTGTYIRSLARDISAKLDTEGYMSSLVRTASGQFLIEDSVALADFIAQPLSYVEGLETTLKSYLDLCEIPQNCVKKITNGVPCAIDGMKDGYCLLTINGQAYALGYTDKGITSAKVNLCQQNQ
ncbi:MAG: tRNA pseudouridine(55) synthase TruB [Christensenellales bacterium]